MAKRTLRVALIGTGFMGRAHSNAHAQVGHFFDVPFEIEKTVICGRDGGRARQMAATWGWNEVETDWRTAVARDDVDIVDVAVPNVLHAPMAIAAARAGKIVFCEKPLAVSAAEAAEMAEAASGVRTMVWFNYRRVPAVAFARQLIGEGRLGQVFHYRATYLQSSGADPARKPGWKTEKAQAGSGALGDLLSHAVDLAMYLNGGISEINAMLHTFAAGRDVDDAVLALARFENGSIGTFEATKYAVGYRNRNAFEIHGSRGMLRFSLEDLNYLEFLDAAEPQAEQGIRRILVTGPDQPYAGVFWKPGHTTGYEHTFIAALGDFLTALATGDPFHPSFEDGRHVQCVLDAVEQSASARQWVRPALT